MNVKFFDLSRQNKLIKAEILEAISRTIDSCTYVSGPEVEKFEEEFASYCGSRYCVAVSSGTAALQLSLLALGNEASNGTITSPATFIATTAALDQAGYIPRFIDTGDGWNCNIDVEKAAEEFYMEENHAPDKVFLPISLYGVPVALDTFNDKVEKWNKGLCETYTVLDNCQGHGNLINGRPVANYCDLATYSFYVTKNLSSFGDGGAICFNDKQYLDYLKSLRNHGRGKEAYLHEHIGYNYRMSEITASILRVKLKYLNEWTNRRIEIAARYRKNLSGNANIGFLPVRPQDKAVYHLFPIFVSNRDNIRVELQKLGVETMIHYPILTTSQPCFSHLKYKNKDFPNAYRQASSEISLPLYPEITNQEIDYVSESLLKVVNQF